jgi:hypothetical protein
MHAHTERETAFLSKDREREREAWVYLSGPMCLCVSLSVCVCVCDYERENRGGACLEVIVPCASIHHPKARSKHASPMPLRPPPPHVRMNATHSHTHTNKQTNKQTKKQTPAHTHTHTHIHTHTHTHTHTSIHDDGTTCLTISLCVQVGTSAGEARRTRTHHVVLPRALVGAGLGAQRAAPLSSIVGPFTLILATPRRTPHSLPMPLHTDRHRQCMCMCT